MKVSNEITEKEQRAKAWAEGIVEEIQGDTRPFVKYKDSRPITDIKNMIETSAKLYSENIAFWDKRNGSKEYEPIKYKQMMEDVNALGTALISAGMKDKRIAVIGDNCYEWAISYLAAVSGCGIVVPLDKELTEDELKNLIIRADVSCVIFAKKYEKMFLSIATDKETSIDLLINFTEPKEERVRSWAEVVNEGRRLLLAGDRSFLDAKIDNEALGVILFTSGTTGKSKGVMLSHRNIAADLMVAPTVLRVHTWDLFFSVLPLHHTYECTCGFLMPIYKGAGIAYCQGLKYITTNLKEISPTMFLGVPLIFENMNRAIWRNIRKEGKEDLLKKIIRINNKTKKIGIDIGKIFFKKITDVFGGRMRIIICGGAAINPDILNGLKDFGIMAVQGYGLTESAPMGALNPDTAAISESIGTHFPSTKIKVIDKDEEGNGEICIKGDNVMLGYYEAPEETAKVLVEGWFHTGDIGYLDDNSYAYITGRKKNVIITKNGKNVYPEEIEYLLGNDKYILEAFVFSQEKEGNQDITIIASIKVDMDAIHEDFGEKVSDEKVKEIIWKEVDAINDGAPFYRKIKKVIIRKKDFVKNTSNKLVRFAEENQEEV